ncbi:hypothetical protein ACFP3R_34265, partial [Saccharothrix lopnurensis]
MNTRSGRSKIRSTVLVLAVTALTAVGALAVVTETTTARAAGDVSIAAVEDDGADCPVTLPGSTP